jgi:hypothetical protein
VRDRLTRPVQGVRDVLGRVVCSAGEGGRGRLGGGPGGAGGGVCFGGDRSKCLLDRRPAGGLLAVPAEN